MKNKCQSFEFDNIDISFQHSVLPENIIGQTKEFDDHSVHKKHGELEKPISNLENENRRIDALDILLYYSCYMISLNGIKLENYLNVI